MSDKNYRLPSGSNYLVLKSGKNKAEVKKVGDKKFTLIEHGLSRTVKIDDKTVRISTKEEKKFWLFTSKGKRILAWPGGSLEFEAEEYSESAGSTNGKLQPLKLTMPGKVLSVKVREGDKVDAGQNLVVIEAMKMENLLLAPASAKIAKIHIKEGERLESGAILISFEAL